MSSFGPLPGSSNASMTDTDVEQQQASSSPNLGQTAIELRVDPQAVKNQSNDANESGSNPNTVDWDGPDDPQNPLNWPDVRKWLNIGLISGLTFVTPLGSSMFAPGVPAIMVEFGESSSTMATFAVSIYVLGFAFGPLLVAPLSETFGRAPVYNWGNVLFVIFSVATALSQNMGMMLIFRFLMGLAGSVPVTIGSGSIADLMPVEQRGRAMAAWALGPLLGPCVGPVAGGYLIQATSWRWVYWVVAIVAGIFVPLSFLYLKETCHPILLERKAARLRMETNNHNLRGKRDSIETPKEMWIAALTRPLKLLFMTPIVTLMAFYVAIGYGILYLLLATFSFVYADEYGFDEGEVGLTFLPAGIGMMFGVVTFVSLSDFMIKHWQAKGGEVTPEVRLTPALVMPCAIVLPVGLFIYGWSAEHRVHWIVPMLGVVVFSCGLMGVMICVQNYLLDTYPRYAASVTAAVAVLRSLAGALLPLGGLQMYDALGLGWGNSLLAFLSVAMIPLPLVFFVFGNRLRQLSNPKL